MISSSREDTTFQVKNLLNCGGKLLDLSTPAIMGILNITPDSFADGGKYSESEIILKHTGRMLEEGAQIIDIGGQSTRPHATYLSAEEEWQRLSEIIPKLISTFPDAIFSIDTFHSSVAEKAVQSGVSIVNDISGGSMDQNMFETVSKLNVPYILMHIKGVPQTMQDNPVYENVVTEILDYFTGKIVMIKKLGIKDIIIDPGFGFGKTVEHNFELLRKLELFHMHGLPVLVGLSRKSMLKKILGIEPKDLLNGSTVLHTLALLKGANILRVHDVKETKECIRIVKEYCS